METFFITGVALFIWWWLSQGLDKKDIRIGLEQGAFLLAVLTGIQYLWGGTMWDDNQIKIVFLLPLTGLAIPCLHFYCSRYTPNLNPDLKNPYNPIDNRHEVFGIFFLSTFFVLLYTGNWLIKGFFWNFIILALFTVLLLIVLIEGIHYYLYHDELRIPSILAVYATNKKEAFEYLQSYVGVKKLLAGSILYSISFVLLYELIYPSYNAVSIPGGVNLHFVFIWSALLLVNIIILISLKRTYFITQWQEARHRINDEALYLAHKKEREGRIEITNQSNREGSILVVIGEAASHAYMKCYNSEYPYDNTPWMGKVAQEDSQFIVFKNAYTCYNATNQALEGALTEMSQYNDKAFSDSISILELARKAGYKTYYFAHHDRDEEVGGNPLAFLADGAENLIFPEQKKDSYDEDLLSCLEKVNPDDNNFIIVHLMGSHARYDCRYPQEWSIYNDGTLMSQYANTIRYTDYVLQQFFLTSKEKLNLQWMLYFSDHGESPLGGGHGANITTQNVLRIPVMLYLSSEYQSKNSNKIQWLKKRKAEYFSNDMLYSTMVGLMGIETNCYDAREDLSSEQFSFTKNNVTTMWKKLHVGELENVGEK